MSITQSHPYTHSIQSKPHQYPLKPHLKSPKNIHMDSKFTHTHMNITKSNPYSLNSIKISPKPTTLKNTHMDPKLIHPNKYGPKTHPKSLNPIEISPIPTQILPKVTYTQTYGPKTHPYTLIWA